MEIGRVMRRKLEKVGKIAGSMDEIGTEKEDSRKKA